MEYVIKCFQTPGGHYVYDRSTNIIFKVKPDEYPEFVQIEEQKLSPENSRFFLKYQKMGVLKQNSVKEIKHAATDLLEHYTSCHLGYLVLQVTQRCNLRCAYCGYGGLYNNRLHSNKNMSFKTATKAIDFYLRHSHENDTAAISFYGGEPLLEFDLIVKCVEYIKNNIERKAISFSITTNGTLLSPEIAGFLAKENFRLSISLDGSREQHDLNRRFPSGEGSFDLIMENVEKIKKNYPDYVNKIRFLTVLNPQMDLKCVKEYFDADSFMLEHNVLYSYVSPTETTNNWDFDRRFKTIWQYEFLKLLLMLTGKLEQKYVSKLVVHSHSLYLQYFSQLHRHSFLPKVFHHGGPCIPGNKKLLVTVDGIFFPCEKCMETNRFFQIGSLDKGLNITQIDKIMNIGKITERKCVDCWLLRHCSICSALYTVSSGNEPCKKDIEVGCQQEKERVLSNFFELSILREHGYGEGITL